jgi:VWFA-related protein
MRFGVGSGYRTLRCSGAGQGPLRRAVRAAAACLLAAATIPGVLSAAPQITVGAPTVPQITLDGTQTTFKSGVDLIAVDVTVLDRSGEPVRGLSADRFEVTVDGRPRRIVSAELLEYSRASDAAAVARDAAAPAFSTNDAPGGAAAVSPSRLVFLAIDEGSFLPAAARSATEAARRFVARLLPQDRVGLVTVPAPGKSVAASTNRTVVLDALSQIVGSAEPIMDSASSIAISLTEAMNIEAGDTLALSMVSDRVCRDFRSANLTQCQEMLRDEARAKSQRAELQAARTLRGLRGIMSGLAGVPERKTVVVVSAGIPVAARVGGGFDARAEITSVVREAAGANATIYVLHIDRTFMEALSAAERQPNPTLFEDAAMLGTGLETLASASGGTLFRVSTNANVAFDAVLRESASSYVLALEPGGADYDGKPHAIKVSVNQPGVVVRSRKEFVLTPRPAAEVMTDPLSVALRTPRASTGLRMGVSTRTLGQAGSGGLRVLIAASVGRGLPGAAELRVGYRVTDAENRTVASHDEKKRLRVSPANPDGAASYASLVALAPGSYNLRIAAVDDAGRTGSVSHAFTAGLGAGEGVSAGDLLLIEPTRTVSDELMVFPDGRIRGRQVGTYLELYGSPGDASRMSVTFSVAERADGPPLTEAKGEITEPDAAAHSSVGGRLDVSLVPPGDYVVVAAVSRGPKVVARRTHLLRIEPAAAAPGGASVSALLPRMRFVLGPSAGLVGAFARTEVLTPAVLSFFVGRLRAADREAVPPGVPEALTALGTGSFDAALAALRDAPAERLSVAFLKGLALLGKGELEPAAAQLRLSLRIADDFLPAAFYLGACYAAGGRDAEATGAWQTALVTEDDARIVYDVLVDALLRQGDAERAVEIIAEARGRWKDDDGFVPRLAVAQAMLLRTGDALATLGTHLEAHRGDAEAAALAVRLIYEARAAGKTVTTVNEDRELAQKYATWHRAAGGPNQALIDRWVAFILKS